MSDEALLTFIDAPSPPPPASEAAGTEPMARLAWRVLVVDDDPDVHETTAFALDGLMVADRPVRLWHAHSAAEGLALLRGDPGFAVVLLDVVMETDDAGLRLVRSVRDELGLLNLRIILRTGQPGQAPELETIRTYDINDYKTKSELTRARLYATLTTALRSYEQLCSLDASRKGLEQIVAASNKFIAEQGLQAFAEGVITQIAGLLGVSPEGVVCAGRQTAYPDANANEVIVIAAAGPYRGLMNQRVADLEDEHIASCLQQSLEHGQNVVDERSVTLYFGGQRQHHFAAYIGARLPIKAVDRHLLEVFCTNISLCATNVLLVKRLRDLAYKDRMLQLPNRVAFIEHLNERVEAGEAGGLVLAKIDVDHFGEVNETLGHQHGDQLLRALAQRLASVLGANAFLGRLGGNTFGVLAPEQECSADQLRSVFDAPFHAGSVSRRLSACIGMLRCGEVHASSANELIEDVFIALKRAKSQGNGRTEWFTQALGADARDRAQLLYGLHRAFDHDRLFLVYQPKVDLRTGRTVGLEALMRWRAEDGLTVPPDRFIPIAEQSGLIVALGMWALRTALNTLQELARHGHHDITMGVNVSAVQMAQPEFLDELDKVLATKGVRSDKLELEVTESVALIGMDRVTELLREVRERGLSIAIDDFGTGFSSLSYLDQLPADRIKIDRAFVEHLENNDRGARIAKLIVPLGHQLGMKVVAEGVETELQLQALRQLGCDEAQGYLFARPMRLEELLAWLDARAQSPSEQA